MKKALKDMIKQVTGYNANDSLICIGGEFYPLPLVQGNSKIGADVWHASTLPTCGEISAMINGETISERGTCPTTCRGCYGTKGNYNFNGVKYSLIMRTRFLRRYPEIYFKAARCQIVAENIKYIRIHATGDFIANEARGWYEIFKDMPQLIGWTYTKCDIVGDIALLDSLSNFNIVDSVIKGCGYNFGHIDYILKTYEALKARGENVYICRCGIDKNQHCSNCTTCSQNKNVLFIEHSTEYKAAADPLYNTIAALIESQPAQKRTA